MAGVPPPAAPLGAIRTSPPCCYHDGARGPFSIADTASTVGAGSRGGTAPNSTGSCLTPGDGGREMTREGCAGACLSPASGASLGLWVSDEPRPG